MYKLVALFALFAVAAADPQVYAYPQASVPLAWAPGYTRTANTVITHSSPLVYSSPVTYTHLIKKRSPQLPLTYVAPSTYFPGTPLATTYSAPLIHTSGVVAPAFSSPVYTTAHLIKKRSAQFLPTTYVAANTYGSPIATSYVASTPYIPSSSIISSHLIAQPLHYAQLIKK